MTTLDRLSALPAVARRTLALLMLASAVLASWCLVVVPLYWLITSQHAWHQQARADLAHSRGEANLLPLVRKRLDSLPRDPIWSRFYDPVAGDVGALVRQDIAQICSDSQISVGSLARLPPHSEGGLVAYGVRLTMSAPADRLRSFVDRLRASARYLRVETLHVSAPEAQRPNENPLLTVTAEIFGYTKSTELPGRETTP